MTRPSRHSQTSRSTGKKATVARQSRDRAAKSQAQTRLEFLTLPSQDSSQSQSQPQLHPQPPPRGRPSTLPSNSDERKIWLEQKRQEKISNETTDQREKRQAKKAENERNRMNKKRHEETKEEREDRKARHRDEVYRSRSSLPVEFKNSLEDPDVQQKLLHFLAKPAFSDYDYLQSPQSPELKKLFASITPEVTKTLIDDLRNSIHRHSIMYGCAVCGRRNLNEPNRVPLKSLTKLFNYDPNPSASLNFSDENKDDEDRNISGLKPGSTVLQMKVDTSNPYFSLAIHPHYMEEKEDNYVPNSKALLCDNCDRCVKEDRLPPYCIKYWDFGNIANLPKLSLLETLLIQRTRPFVHIAKLVDGKGKFTLSGHCMAIPTTAADLVSQTIAEEQTAFPRRVKVDDCGLSVVFVGAMDRWKRILEGKGPNSFYLQYQCSNKDLSRFHPSSICMHPNLLFLLAKDNRCNH